MLALAQFLQYPSTSTSLGGDLSQGEAWLQLPEVRASPVFSSSRAPRLD
jgi:hypothetical protein